MISVMNARLIVGKMEVLVDIYADLLRLVESMGADLAPDTEVVLIYAPGSEQRRRQELPEDLALCVHQMVCLNLKNTMLAVYQDLKGLGCDVNNNMTLEANEVDALCYGEHLVAIMRDEEERVAALAKKTCYISNSSIDKALSLSKRIADIHALDTALSDIDEPLAMDAMYNKE